MPLYTCTAILYYKIKAKRIQLSALVMIIFKTKKMKQDLIKGNEENRVPANEIPERRRSGWWYFVKGLLSSVPPFEKRKTDVEFSGEWIGKRKSKLKIWFKVKKE
jgi:hypothetical protein